MQCNLKREKSAEKLTGYAGAQPPSEGAGGSQGLYKAAKSPTGVSNTTHKIFLHPNFNPQEQSRTTEVGHSRKNREGKPNISD